MLFEFDVRLHAPLMACGGRRGGQSSRVSLFNGLWSFLEVVVAPEVASRPYEPCTRMLVGAGLKGNSRNYRHLRTCFCGFLLFSPSLPYGIGTAYGSCADGTTYQDIRLTGGKKPIPVITSIALPLVLTLSYQATINILWQSYIGWERPGSNVPPPEGFSCNTEMPRNIFPLEIFDFHGDPVALGGNSIVLYLLKP